MSQIFTWIWVGSGILLILLVLLHSPKGDGMGGIAASGGTLNNLNAMVTAKYNSGYIFDNNVVLILSEDAHVSFKKCARILKLHTIIPLLWIR